MAYKTNTMRLWQTSKDCTCLQNGCNAKNHKLCPICSNLMLFGSHLIVEKLNKSEFSWNTDLIVPKINGGNNKIANLQAVHIKCNKSKNRKDQSGEY